MEEKAKKLEVHMLGGLSAWYDGKPIVLGKKGLSKSVQLLLLLLLNGKEGVSKEHIYEALYDWEDIIDKNNSLNNLIYRLKKQLVSSGLDKQDFIEIVGGVVRISPSFPTSTDAASFVEAVEHGMQADDIEAKIKYLKEACQVYQGEFLPQLANETWVRFEAEKMKGLFEKSIRELGPILQKREEYSVILEIYRKAADLYPFEDWQISQIECLRMMNRFEDAYDVYQNTIKLYSTELGMPPSQRIIDFMKMMSRNVSNDESEIGRIIDRLSEREKTDGAYYCEYPSFVDAFRYICRSTERKGQTVFLMLCEVKQDAGDGKEKNLQDFGKKINFNIGPTLRGGDLYTRYSSTQFIVLLTAIRKQDCDYVFKRINKYFRDNNPNLKCYLDYTIREIKTEPDMMII